MMQIAIFPYEKKAESIQLAKEICSFFTKKNIQVVSDKKFSKTLGCKPITPSNKKKIQFLIALGGDGSILHIAHKYQDLNKPIVGINLGTIGFMADIPISNLYTCLNDLLNKSYTIEERIVLEGKNKNNKKFFAVNEFVIHRANNHSIIELAIYVDGIYFNTFAGDGILIATPNGSTAYSLAAGGPILSTNLEAFVITPICPHTISNRPIVITTDHEIEVQYLSEYEMPIEVRGDGFCHDNMKTKDIFKFKKSKKTFKLVKLNRHDYFSTLRTKLGWSGRLP